MFVDEESFGWFYVPRKILSEENRRELKCLFENDHPRHDLQLVLSPIAEPSAIQNLFKGLNNSFSKIIILLRETKNPSNRTLINNNPSNGTNDTTAKNYPFVEM